MKYLALTLIVAFSFATVSITGCGGSGESTVIESDPSTDGGLTGQDASSYEEAMKDRAKQAKPSN